MISPSLPPEVCNIYSKMNYIGSVYDLSTLKENIIGDIVTLVSDNGCSVTEYIYDGNEWQELGSCSDFNNTVESIPGKAIKMHPVTCPNCGASCNTPVIGKPIRCEYCKTYFYISPY